MSAATTFAAEVFDVCRVDQASAVVHVAASGPDGHVGWTTTNPPARGTRVAVTITNEGEPMNADTEARRIVEEIEDCYSHDNPPPVIGYVRRLEQRIAAAELHIDRARAHGNDVVRAELVAALDVLRGEAC